MKPDPRYLHAMVYNIGEVVLPLWVSIDDGVRRFRAYMEPDLVLHYIDATLPDLLRVQFALSCVSKPILYPSVKGPHLLDDFVLLHRQTRWSNDAPGYSARITQSCHMLVISQVDYDEMRQAGYTEAWRTYGWPGGTDAPLTSPENLFVRKKPP